jgi:hypothetical protein
MAGYTSWKFLNHPLGRVKKHRVEWYSIMKAVSITINYLAHGRKGKANFSRSDMISETFKDVNFVIEDDVIRVDGAGWWSIHSVLNFTVKLW